MAPPKASIIISVYNEFPRLQKVLAGLERQTKQDFEIVFSDDGSNEDTVTALQKYAESSKVPTQHIWHEDNGFRKTIILNKSIQAAKSDLLIFLDADCVPHPKYVEEHFAHRAPNTVVTGRRVHLSPKLTEWLTLDRIKSGALEKPWFTLKIFANSLNGTKQAEKAIYKRNLPFNNLLKEKYKGILGSNWSVNKKDLFEINGFDERYLAPAAGEDTDPQFRFAFAGKKVIPIGYHALQYHLYHKQQPRPQINKDIMQTVIDAGKPWTEYGIKQTEEAKAYLKTLSPTK